MTQNNSYGTHKACEPYRDCAKCKPKHPNPQNVLLECGQGTGSRTFSSSSDTPFQLAHVILDTACLNKPEVLIKFSSLVRIERLELGDVTVRLQYELLRVCEGGDPISLGTWLFEKIDITIPEFVNAAEESFNFIFCECTNCPRCCEYFVTVTPLEIINARVTVNNGRMAALSGALCDSLGDEHKTYDPKYDDTRLKQKYPKPKEVIFKCGQETGSVVFNRQNEPPVRIANVTIDTSCLCKPEVLVEFSSIVSYAVVRPPGDPVRLQFELFRVCDNGDPVSRGIWTFEVDFVNQGSIFSKAFGFIFCECVTFSDCCEYFVTLTPIEVPTGFAENAMISDSRIAALVQSDIAHDKKQDTIDCGPGNKPKSKELLLGCGKGTGSNTFSTQDDSGFQLAQVTIDTTSLCKPKVNIEFSSLVSFETQAGFIIARLRYELFRICDDGQPESRGVWVWRREKVSNVTSKVTESFDFTFCEPIGCKSGCCIYFVKVTPIEIMGDQVTVSNGRMAALAQESCYDG